MSVDHDDSQYGSQLMKVTQLTVQGRTALTEGDGPRALDILSRKHEILLKIFPPGTSSVGTSLIDLSEALLLVGRQQESRKAIEEALVIFKQLDRRDEMRERLELHLIEVCRRQGHAFLVESLLRERIERGDGPSLDEALARAVNQDELPMQFIQQRQYDKALPLLMDSKAIFERAGEAVLADLSVCHLYLSRLHLQTEEFEPAVAHGRSAVDCAKRAKGPDSFEVAMTRDELAVSLAFCARRDNDAAAARESLALSESSLARFAALQGPFGKEASRSAENNRRLRVMLAPLMGTEPEMTDLPEPPTAVALPTYAFISHAYSDDVALRELLESLPPYVKPVVFEAIDAPPSELVSEKLINGVLSAEGLVYIDNAASHSSFWCAFERDLAARKHKRMFRFDPSARIFEEIRSQPRELKLAHCFHPADGPDVRRVMRWLVDERSFAAFHDEDAEQSSPAFASMEDTKRDMTLFSLRTFGTLYLLFLSAAVMRDDRLRKHAIDQLRHHPHATLVCWLPPKPRLPPFDLIRALLAFPRQHVVAFSQRPTNPDFNVHALDDLGVRLYWAHHRVRAGDWSL